MSFNGGGASGKPCKNFCKFYNFNATSAVIEGYTVYFNDIISQFKTFLSYEGLHYDEKAKKLKDDVEGKAKKFLDAIALK